MASSQAGALPQTQLMLAGGQIAGVSGMPLHAACSWVGKESVWVCMYVTVGVNDVITLVSPRVDGLGSFADHSVVGIG